MKYDYQIDMTTDNSLSLILRRIQPGTKVLEFGPANGYMTRYLQEQLGCKVVCVELNEDAAIQAAQYAEQMIVADLDELKWCEQLEGMLFDHLIFADVLEHLKNPWLVLEKAKSFLRTGGTVLTSIPNIGHNAVILDLLEGKFDYRNLGLLDNTHIRFFTKNSILNLFEKTGLVPVEWYYTVLTPDQTEIQQTYERLPPTIQSYLKDKPDAHVYQYVTVSKKGEDVDVEDIKQSIPLVQDTVETTDTFHVFWNLGRESATSFAYRQVKLNGEYIECELALSPEASGRLLIEPCYRPAYMEIKSIAFGVGQEMEEGKPQLVCSPENSFSGLQVGKGVVQLEGTDTIRLLTISNVPQLYYEKLPASPNGEPWIMRIVLRLAETIPDVVAQEINQKITELIRIENELTTITQELQVTRQELDLQKERLESAQSDHAQVAEWLDQMIHSTSWRLTAPLRGLGAFARQILDAVFVKSTRKLLDKLEGSESAKQTHKKIFNMGRTLPEPLRGYVKSRYYRMLHVKNRIKYGEIENKSFEPIDVKDYKVSIIIPVYNNKEYLEDCIRSAVQQTYENKEVILVNDCSPQPEVAEILAKFKHYDFVKIYENEKNMGISKTQNACLAKATGNVIAFLDCDDLLEPNAIERSLAYWTTETKYTFTNRIHIDENSEEIGRLSFDHLPMIDVFEDHLDVNMYASHLKIISRDVFVKVGVFNSDYDGAQDYDMVLRVAHHYPRSAFVHVPEFLYKHRIHQKQKSITANEKQKNMSHRISDQAKMRRDIRQGKFHKFLSFIVVSFGKEDQTLQLMQSIKRTVRVPHEIILLDNGSNVECVAFIREHIEPIEGVKVFYSDRNLGPAGGRREALKHASKDAYYISLDNDIEVTEGWLEELLVRAEESDEIGSVTCRVAFPNLVLQFTGGYEEISKNRVKFKLYNEGKSVLDLATLERYDTAWNPVGATLFKGYFPEVEGYPNVYEDSAISYVLRKSGKKLVNSPNSLVIHHHIMFDDKRKDREKDYLAFRYNPQLMLKSLATFFFDNGLIIDDPYIYSTNKLKIHEMTDQEVIQVFEELAKEDQKTLVKQN